MSSNFDAAQDRWDNMEHPDFYRDDENEDQEETE